MSDKIKNVRYALVALLLFFCAVVQAQTVSGNVKDALGDGVIGATVMEQGTKNGTVTDMDGNFTIKLQGKSRKLVFSYVGMKNKVVDVAGKSSINVMLEDDANTLNDLVVVGYGTVKKNDLTGSVSSVGTEQLNAKGAPSVMESLQGATPGVNITPTSGRVGEGFKIEIRGASSVNSATTPLYVVDGVMCDDIDWLNTQDIERIDILKDASSTAIYGSRATAGVVMVTTKGGSNVKKQERATISYDGYYGWTKTARMPEFMDGQEFYNYRFLKFLAPSVANTSAQANPAAPTYGMADAAILGQCLLQTSSADTSSPFIMKQMLSSGKTYDWPDLVTRTGEQQNHYLAVKGSSEKINYHVGLGYNKEKGIYEKDDQGRINFKGSLDAKINDLVSIGFNANMAHVDRTSANDEAVQFAYRMNPYMTPYDANGNVILKPGNKETLGTDNNQFSDQVSPLKYMQNSKNERETWRVLGNLYVQFDFMKGLNLKSTFSPNYVSSREGYFEGYEDDLNPGYTYANAEIKEGNTWSTGYYRTFRKFNWTWDNVINWNKTFNKIHSINVMGLFSMNYTNRERSFWQGQNTNLVGSDWWAMQEFAEFDSEESFTAYDEESMISYAFRLNYGYMDRYLLTATMRADGSSKFAEGNRWGTFPSFAFAWRATEEELLKNVEWLNNLKLRLAYGVTGNNSGIGYYDTQAVPLRGSSYALAGKYGRGYTTAVVDKNLQWETSHEFNIGLDFAFLKNRLSGTIDWYTKKSNDLLFDVSLPLEAGIGAEGKNITLTTNVGSVRNTGIEASLTGIIVDNKDWNVSLTANIAHNKNEVLEINGTGDRLVSNKASGVLHSLFVGMSTNVLWGYVQDGIVSDQMMTVPNHQIARDKGFTPGQQVKSSDYYYATYGWIEGQPIIRDMNGDGKLDQDNDRGFFSADPKFTGSISANVSYKNWDFSTSLYAKVGQHCYSYLYSDYINWADRGRQKLSVDYYIPAGTLIDCDGINADGTYVNPKYQETTHYGEYPFPNNGNSNGVGNAKSYWDEAKCITKTSFAKIKNITLGYTFPKEWLKPVGCAHLRLYFTVTNPFVFTKYKGFDPEWANVESLKKDGPSTTTYQLGASIKF